MATLDGDLVFGSAVKVIHTPKPSAQQIVEFFGADGLSGLYAGARGRTFLIEGVFTAPDPPSCGAAEAALLSYADGQPHTLVDNLGRSWDNVIFSGEYKPFEKGPRPTIGGWCLPYKCVMWALT